MGITRPRRVARKDPSGNKAAASPPSNAVLFAQAVLDNYVPSVSRAEADASAERERLERLAGISTVHEERLRRLLRAEAAERERQELLEFVAAVSTVREDWDPAKHPRGAFPENRGWWSPTGVSSGGQETFLGSGPMGGKSADIDDARSKFRAQSNPTPKQGMPVSGLRIPQIGIGLTIGHSGSPFVLASFSLNTNKTEISQFKSLLGRLGIRSVSTDTADGSTTFSLAGEPSKFSWNVKGNSLERAVVEGMLRTRQGFEYKSYREFSNDAHLLENAVQFARTQFRFLGGTFPKFPRAYFNEEADLLPGVSPAKAVRAIYKYADDVDMACRNGTQFAVLRALIEVFGDTEFDRVLNSYRDTSKPFNILDMKLFDGEDAAFVKWTSTTDFEDIIPGQWVYALGNREDGELPGYEGSNFIVQPGLYYRSPWGATLLLADHLVDTFLYKYRWKNEQKDGVDKPIWSKWSNNSNEPGERELIPIDRNSPVPVAIRGYLTKTPAGTGETIIGGITVLGIFETYRGTPRLLENPRPNEKLNR